MKSILIISFIVIVSGSAMAQTSGGVNSGTLSTSSSIFSNPSLIAGWKSYDDAARPEELSTPGKRQFKSKNEFFLGMKSQAGYGLLAQAVEVAQVFSAAPAGAASSNISYSRAGDASLSFFHPIYSNDRLVITGSAREYFPFSPRSVAQGIYQQAYYVNLIYMIRGGYDLMNQLVPRYFSQQIYKPTDGVFYTEDWTTLSTRARPWLRVGFGQHYQVETHSATPTGQTLELFPFADFMLTNTVYMGPRVYFPVAVQNSIYDAPTAVSINNAQAELYFQATL